MSKNIVVDQTRDIVKPLRRAVYTRVSVADHQSSELTSIDVQVEACRACVREH